MSHVHTSNDDAPWIHRFLLHLYGVFPILSLRVFKWGAEASLWPVAGWPIRRVMTWYARHLERGRVVTFAEVEHLVLDAESCSIGDCPCLHIYPDDCEHTREKCVRLNMAHDVAVRLDRRHHRTIEKDELLERLRQLSQEQGLHHTVVFLGGPAYAICTCCENCIAYQMFARYGQPDALLKGRYVSRVASDRCVGCGQCTSACRFDAMADGQADTDKCHGCGLCAAACPNEAITMELRERSDASLPEAAG